MSSQEKTKEITEKLEKGNKSIPQKRKINLSTIF
jgi:hypothetical protein